MAVSIVMVVGMFVDVSLGRLHHMLSEIDYCYRYVGYKVVCFYFIVVDP